MLLVVGGYVLGTLPSAQIVGRRTGHDPTREGSGNPGATNMYRTAGRRAGALVLAGDLLKGAVAAGLGWALGDHTLGVACGVAAVAGHVFPFHRPRHGGKGVATGGGATIVLFPLLAAVAVVVFALVVKVGRRVSVGSLVLAVGIPAGAAALGAPGVEVVLLAGMGAAVVLRHAGNIARLARGTESTIGSDR